MRSRRKDYSKWYNQIWRDNIWFHFKKPIIIGILIICSLISLTYLGFKGYNYIQESKKINAEWEIVHQKLLEEREEKERKKKEEYEQWLNSPYNAVKLAKRRAEIEEERKQELKERERKAYKIGDQIIILDLDNAINFQGKLIANRIGVDVVRGFTEYGSIIGDKGTYSRDYIRKPFSKSEFRELLNLELKGELK